MRRIPNFMNKMRLFRFLEATQPPAVLPAGTARRFFSAVRHYLRPGLPGTDGCLADHQYFADAGGVLRASLCPCHASPGLAADLRDAGCLCQGGSFGE